MMFILDAIQCAAEEAVMFAEEKAALWQEARAIKRMSRREAEEEQKMGENPFEEDETADNSLDDFDEYLRKCALGVLAPFGKPDDGIQEEGKGADKTSNALTEEMQEELKTIVQSIESKLSERDKKEIIESLKSKNLSMDVNKLFGVHDDEG